MTLIASRLIRKSGRAGAATLDYITLDSDSRHMRRARLTTDGGRTVVVDLNDASFMQDGDALATEDGLIVIRAAAEPLLEIKAENALALARVAWHLGNRHAATEVTADAIFIQPDHVLEHMVEGLGAMVRHVSRPFQPEAGAYSGGAHGHGH